MKLSKKETNIEWGGFQGPMTWAEAKKLEVGDWRLPTLSNLTSLFYNKKHKAKAAPMQDKIFWTGMRVPSSVRLAYAVPFSLHLCPLGHGFEWNRTDSYFVRLVRGTNE